MKNQTPDQTRLFRRTVPRSVKRIKTYQGLLQAVNVLHVWGYSKLFQDYLNIRSCCKFLDYEKKWYYKEDYEHLVRQRSKSLIIKVSTQQKI
ncbi:hypothetical protein C2G38_2207781 [Gigaspora rosea]|uniref:Uncharacterized protein n=1 Tax=Gigaspora rosea TaxID=44941 RepID=A0A397UI57_9GLOM|nr:hypothetical protein C2G38_2207781 [Gigaspora rosea]